MILKDRRLGKFSICIKDINENPELVLAILSKVIVVKADLVIYKDEVEYQAISEHFFLLNPLNMIPTYKIIISMDEDRIQIDFSRERE